MNIYSTLRVFFFQCELHLLLSLRRGEKRFISFHLNIKHTEFNRGEIYFVTASC